MMKLKMNEFAKKQEDTITKQFLKDIIMFAKYSENYEKNLAYIIKYNKEYLLLYFFVKKAFIEIDPLHIACACWYEYDVEIFSIINRLIENNLSLEVISNTTRDVLKEYFNGDYKDDAIIIAKNIMKNLERYKDNFLFSEDITVLYNSYIKDYPE